QVCSKGTSADYGATSCAKCSQGYYSVQNSSATCIPCAPGYFCDDSTQCPQQCQAGSYSSAAQTTCYQCSSTCSSTPGVFDCSTCITAKPTGCQQLETSLDIHKH
ncbi:unnamed protein product, partial [Rotaria sp. Silwood2]